MGIYFISGTYGVGKSTLAQKLSTHINIPHYSASKLISQVTGANYITNKTATDISTNQAILVNCILNILSKADPIILSGHFCIINQHGGIVHLPEEVFDKLHIEKIILLEAAADVIANNLLSRDKKVYPISLIQNLMHQEREFAQLIANRLSLPFSIHYMTYSNRDLSELLNIIKQADAHL